MSTDLTPYDPAAELNAQMDFARMVAPTNLDQRALAQSILPDCYKGSPANVVIAVGLGRAMGLSPAESLYRISVIKGKPSAAAELIASNVRKAGHKLRIQITEEPPSATCTITRVDDPEPTVITRDMAWAQRMGLANEPNYRKQPATMLGYRAISACARLACPEALYGVSYTPDEAADIPDREPAQGPKPTGMAALRQAVATEPVEVSVVNETTGEVAPPANPRGRMFALLAERNITDPNQQRAGMSEILGREVTSRASLTPDEMHRISEHLLANVPVQPALKADAEGTQDDPWAGEQS